MSKKPHRLCSVLLLAGTCALPVMAQDADLTIKHLSITTGADGVKHTVEYADRMVRRDNQVWVERVVPANPHSAGAHNHDHDVSKGHKHLEVSTAARWIVRGADGTVAMQLAAHEERALVNISKVDYQNVGFDGSWDAAYHLIDPALLKRMKVASTQGNLVTYTSSEGRDSVKVVWNSVLKLPVSVETRTGTSSKRTSVEVLAKAKSLPWEAVKKYQVKEYSDYLD